jgi:hypothetical protein
MVFHSVEDQSKSKYLFSYLIMYLLIDLLR